MESSCVKVMGAIRTSDELFCLKEEELEEEEEDRDFGKSMFISNVRADCLV